MGLFWWRRSKDSSSSSGSDAGAGAKTTQNAAQNPVRSAGKGAEEVPGMNGAMEVRRPGPGGDVTIFEFGSIATSTDKVTLSGCCPVSDELEPCRWELLPASGSDAPQFRLVF